METEGDFTRLFPSRRQRLALRGEEGCGGGVWGERGGREGGGGGVVCLFKNQYADLKKKNNKK